MIARFTGARLFGAVAVAALGVCVTSPAHAQRRPSIVIMPAQYFGADEQSARNLTQSLAEQFERQGYTVISSDRAESAWQSMNLSSNTHYPDRVAVRFGRQAGADLVAYPRLLSLGIPAVNPPAEPAGMLEPAAVVHLRVLNARTGGNIYFRQIAHEFRSDAAPQTNTTVTEDMTTTTVRTPDFTLPQPVATAAANEVTSMYFQNVAGSRQEMRTVPVTRTRARRR